MNHLVKSSSVNISGVVQFADGLDISFDEKNKSPSNPLNPLHTIPAISLVSILIIGVSIKNESEWTISAVFQISVI